MKTHQLTFVTILLTFSLISVSEAQPTTIDSLKIIPTNLSTNDIVKVVSYINSSINPCNLTSSNITIIDSTINVYASHSSAGIMLPCNSIDTLTIGQLNAGNYVLYYHFTDTTIPTTYDIDTIVFTVQQASGFQLTDNSDQEIKVYPNPVTMGINIYLKTYSADKHNIDIYSVLGQKVKTVKDGKDIVTIDISDLTDGIYFVITSGQDRRWTHKIIKNAP